MIFYILFLIISGIIPQENNNSLISSIGLTHIVQSYPFAFITLILILNLMLAIWKRIFMPLTLKNITFLINHIGILIVLMFASLAAFDLIKTTMYVEKGKVIWYAFKDNKEVVELPFAIELKDFRIDYFEPNIQLLKVKNITNNQFEVITQKSISEKDIKLKNFHIKINKIVPFAWFMEDTVISNFSPGYTKGVHATIFTNNKT
ncbi:MAG: cytochrome c biogenesis protein ResB, partial [Fervidobacterium sp.]